MKLLVVVAISVVVVLVLVSYSLGYHGSFVVEQIPWEGILAVIGVMIGFLLSQLTDLVRNRRRKTLIKRALINELSIIRKTLSDALKIRKTEFLMNEFL